MATLEITFKLETSGTSFAIENKNDEVASVVQNIGNWLHKLTQHALTRKLDMMSQDKTPEVKAAMLKHIDDELALSKQIFNDYRVVGTMGDGKQFVFTHKEPGYQETLEFK